MTRPPLEQMYPARCYDCLTPTQETDAVLCAACWLAAHYADNDR